MKIIITIMVILCLSINIIVLADEKITESYIIKVLEGKDRDSEIPKNKTDLISTIPLLSFMIDFSPKTLEINQESYMILNMIVNIVSNKSLLNSKFLIVCCSDIKHENRNAISLELSEHIKDFMMKKLSEDQERLIIRTAEEYPSLLQTRIETGAGVGRLEFFRVE